MYAAVFLCLLYALSLVNANNEFIIPPPAGAMANLDMSFFVQWRCDDCALNGITLNVWQNMENGSWAQETLLADVLNPGNYSWTAHTLEDLTIANGFHFGVSYGTAPDEAFDSGALFIQDALSLTSTPNAEATSIVSLPSPSASPTSVLGSFTSSISLSTSTILSSSTASATSFSNPGPTTPSSDANTEALKVGLGVGLGLGIPFLLLVGGIIGYVLFRRRPETRQKRIHEPYDDKGRWSAYAMEGQIQEMSGDGSRHELYEERRPSELQG